MNYDETLEKIHSFQKYGSKLGLERMSVLMNLLGNPQDKMKTIHVAGTNGKGSVCRFIATVLQEHGYKVGLYTSPYLERFTERIEFDGKEISGQDLVFCADRVFDAVQKMQRLGYESPTEFELVTAIGFVYFSRKPMDFLVLEVGLGGRGDSTNLIKEPLVSVITSISYDHMEQLGDSLEKIALEKAGIIKEASPVVSNVKDAGAAYVIEKVAEEKGCEFYNARNIEVRSVKKSLMGYSFDTEQFGFIELGMIGMHQVENAICALNVIEVLKQKGIIVTEAGKIRNAMKHACQKGRFEIIDENPYIIIDGAHNEAGVQALSRVVNEHFQNKKMLYVVGMLADKQVERLVACYAELTGDIVATQPDNPRRLDADILSQKINDAGRYCKSVGDWEDACNYVQSVKPFYEGVIFSGSLYLIGRVREKLLNGIK